MLPRPTVKIGFTGTRHGMNARQKRHLRLLLAGLRKKARVEFHHGDCIGADAEAHAIAVELKCTVVVHPPDNDAARAFVKGTGIIRWEDPLPYIVRNHRIVDATKVLVATPHTNTEQLRSGTWATVRYAVSKRRKVLLMLPQPKSRSLRHG